MNMSHTFSLTTLTPKLTATMAIHMRFIDRAAVEMRTPKLNKNTKCTMIAQKKRQSTYTTISQFLQHTTPFHRQHRTSNAGKKSKWQDERPSHVRLKHF
jgi:hypothetical protein